MMKGKIFLLAAVLCACVQFLGSRQAGLVNAGPEQIQATVEDGVIWTKWDADHYALADDGDSIWIGTASGLIRWHKDDGSYTRISTADGLPHQDVLAAAVDGQGNRWFGGDGGLSRLEMAETWTHYDTANSGMHSNGVYDIAAAADGTVWLSHAGDPKISQLSPDGSWAVYADRKTTVAANYAAVKQTVNDNSLWTVAGEEVWVRYERYDGSSWQTVAPPNAGQYPWIVAADSKGKIWSLDEYTVYAWDGMDWAEYPFFYYFDGYLNTLAIGENDEVWVGWQERYGNPYSNQSAGISQLPDTAEYIDLDQFLGVPPPVADLLPSAAGLWGTGPNWLLLPDSKIVQFSDEPFFKNVNAVVVDRQGRTWLHSSFYWPYTAGVMQTLDDKGTATMADDEGKVWSGGWPSIIRALEPAPNGDLWIAWEDDWRFRFPGGPLRFTSDSAIDYYPPSYNGFIGDIFVQDGGRAWFTYAIPDGEKGVWSLDDGGTPLEPSDDIWQSYPIETNGGDGLVAVQEGRIWYGDSSGLYLYKESGWEPVSTVAVTDLVPAAGGALFVGVSSSVLIVERDGRQSLQPVAKLITNELARVRSARRRNQMWTVAPDGGVWYWKGPGQLARRDDGGEQVYQMAVTSDIIEVDENNHVWLANGALWRMSPEPDFDSPSSRSYGWSRPRICR